MKLKGELKFKFKKINFVLIQNNKIGVILLLIILHLQAKLHLFQDYRPLLL